MESQAQFVEHLYSVLSIEHLASFKVYDSMACILQCLRSALCYSVNFSVDSDDQGYLCELLPADRYKDAHAGQFKESKSYHHYSIATPCDNNQCKPGAKCRPLYGSDGFSCERITRVIEEAVPWFKANSNKVCFGAKDDSYGKFNMPLDGTVVSLKLVYVSGYVACQTQTLPYGSNWGCTEETLLTTLVTNDRNEVVFPRYRQSKAYKIPGQNFNSPELVFKILPRLLRLNVAAGEEFRIWYRQDLLNGSESNNAGQTCTDVYVLYV
ncbi:hypothetical protein ACROYT_G005173 [Oculina patagonica]